VRIFVAYGYNERDQWIKDMVFPIITAFGSEVAAGDVTYEGSNIPDHVRTNIRFSDALIGFTTRRSGSQGELTSQTHRWVISELAAAFALKRRVVEVREQGVDSQDDLLQGLQRIEYDEQARDQCLVEIVKAVGSWHRRGTVRLQLLPQQVNEDLRPLLNNPGLTCEYVVRMGNYEEDPRVAKIVPIKGGMFIDASDVPREALIQIRVQFGEESWSSDYESIDAYGVYLR
jgi:hypothetical protein